MFGNISCFDDVTIADVNIGLSIIKLISQYLFGLNLFFSAFLSLSLILGLIFKIKRVKYAVQARRKLCVDVLIVRSGKFDLEDASRPERTLEADMYKISHWPLVDVNHGITKLEIV